MIIQRNQQIRTVNVVSVSIRMELKKFVKNSNAIKDFMIIAKLIMMAKSNCANYTQKGFVLIIIIEMNNKFTMRLSFFSRLLSLPSKHSQNVTLL
jgi:hypothetical protein